MRDGAWAGFKAFAFDGSERRVIVTARGTAEGTLKAFCERDASAVASVPVYASTDWTAFPAPIHLSAGVYPLYFVYDGSSAMEFVSFEIE